MTNTNRPAAFKKPEVRPKELKLFFGKGDYVIAATPAEASVFWMDHFNDLSYAKDFELVPDEERIEIFLDDDDTSCEFWVMTREEIAAHCPNPPPDQWFAQDLIERFGAGYLASTEE